MEVELEFLDAFDFESIGTRGMEKLFYSCAVLDKFNPDRILDVYSL